MTESSRHYGWVVAAIAAPAAAAVFAGTAAWANAYDPLAQKRHEQSLIDSSVETLYPSQETLAAEQQLLDLQTRLDELVTAIDKVKAQTSRVKGSTPVVIYRPPSGGSGGSGGSSAPPASSGSTGGSQ
jgi:hypothetical protein